jgi:hypothetical protein
MKTTLTTAQAAHLLIDDENANWSRAGAIAFSRARAVQFRDRGKRQSACGIPTN